MTWVQRIIAALERLGGEATYRDLYEELGRETGRPLTHVQQATVRKEVERFSSDSDNWDGVRPNLFYSVSGLGSGQWGLRRSTEISPVVSESGSATLVVQESELLLTEALSPDRREYIRELLVRNRKHVADLKSLYGGLCQISGKPVLGGLAGDITEAHHIEWLTRGGQTRRTTWLSFLLICTPLFTPPMRCSIGAI